MVTDRINAEPPRYSRAFGKLIHCVLRRACATHALHCRNILSSLSHLLTFLSPKCQATCPCPRSSHAAIDRRYACESPNRRCRSCHSQPTRPWQGSCLRSFRRSRQRSQVPDFAGDASPSRSHGPSCKHTSRMRLAALTFPGKHSSSGLARRRTTRLPPLVCRVR